MQWETEDQDQTLEEDLDQEQDKIQDLIQELDQEQEAHQTIEPNRDQVAKQEEWIWTDMVENQIVICSTQ